MPDQTLTQLFAAQGGSGIQPATTDQLYVVSGGVSRVTTVQRLLSTGQPVRQVPGLTDTPTTLDASIGQLIECTAVNVAPTIVTILADGPVDATHQPWTLQNVLDYQQMGTSQVQFVVGPGVTFLAPHGQKTVAQGSRVQLRHHAVNAWVISGDTTP